MVAPTPGELAVKIGDHEKRLDKNDRDHAEIRESVNTVRNRPPVWASLLLAALLALTSALITASVAGG